MTYQSDYILRMIEQLAQAMATLRNRLLGRGPDKDPLLAEVRTIAADADVDLELARTLDPDSLRMLMSLGGEVDRGRCWLTAELLALEAAAAEQAGNRDVAVADLERAVELYGWLPPDWRPAPGQAPVGHRLTEAEAALTDLSQHRPGPLV